MFYHLTTSTAEALVPMLIGRAQEAGWRVEIRGTDRARIVRLDDLLWQGDGFLPHAVAGGAHDARQPVLLTVAGDDPHAPANDAACLIAVDGATVGAGECAMLDRVCIIFDGNDPAALDHARGQWRALTGAGTPAEYWSQASGRWERKA